MNVRSVSGRG